MKRISSILVLIIIFSFSFGVATMDMDENGNMSDCPFTGTATICPMSFTEHISTFQSIFRAIPAKIILLLVLVLVSLLILCSRLIRRIYSPPIQSEYFVKNDPCLLIFNKILLALSDGIIQPKLYF